MKKIVVKNTLTQKIIAEASVLDADAEIIYGVSTGMWGRPARECPKTDTDYDLSLVIEEFEKEISPALSTPIYEVDAEGHVVLDGEGNPIQIGTNEVPAVFQTWVRLKAEHEITTTDISAQHAQEQRIKAKIIKGENLQTLTNTLINLITGDNLENRTAAEITQMQTDFATIFALINAGRLISAKPLIQAIDTVAKPEYAELKEDILTMYALNGF